MPKNTILLVRNRAVMSFPDYQTRLCTVYRFSISHRMGIVITLLTQTQAILWLLRNYTKTLGPGVGFSSSQ